MLAVVGVIALVVALWTVSGFEGSSTFAAPSPRRPASTPNAVAGPPGAAGSSAKPYATPRPSGSFAPTPSDPGVAWLGYVIHLEPSFDRFNEHAESFEGTAETEDPALMLPALHDIRSWAVEERDYHATHPPHACYANVHAELQRLAEMMYTFSDDAIRAIGDGDIGAAVRLFLQTDELERTFDETSIDELFKGADERCYGLGNASS